MFSFHKIFSLSSETLLLISFTVDYQTVILHHGNPEKPWNFSIVKSIPMNLCQDYNQEELNMTLIASNFNKMTLSN